MLIIPLSMKVYLRLLLIPLAMAWLHTVAQETVNTKFGKPTKEELQMTTYEADPEAEAVVLCRLTDVEYTVQTSSYLVDYREKWRIKVLKPDGARFAKVVVPYQMFMSVGNNISGLRSSFMTIPVDRISGNSAFQEQDGSMSDGVFGTDGDESVEDIKATAFNLEGGKVVKTSLKKSDVVTTKLDEQNYRLEFTVPNVKEGTVIEYEYRIHSQLFWQLRDWYAQCEIPVVYAKLDMNIPNFLIFNIEDHGIQRLTYTCTVGSLKYKVESDPLANPMWVNTNHYIYVGRDLAGMPKDDYLWNVQDYWAGITAELKEYRLRGMKQMDFAKTWEQIDNMLLDDEDLGQQLNAHSPLREEMERFASIADERERAIAVYQQVMSHVKWDGTYKICPQKSDETLKQGSGSNADINMLLIQSLHDAGLTATPVVLRTRDEGRMPYNFPSIQKLTSFVVGITPKSGATFFLDASSTEGYLNVLPAPLLVERSRLVAKNKGSKWVNLQKLSRSEITTVIDAVLTADGKMSGKQTTLYKGLAASDFRHHKANDSHGNVKGSGFGPEATEEVEFTKQGEVSSGTISICPFNEPPMDGNPFTASKRKMPVEFPSALTHKVIVNITIPEGYVLASETKQQIVFTPDKGIDGRLSLSNLDGRVQMQYLFNVNKIAHSEQNYADLRQIFEMFTQYSHQLLVFKKN